MRCRIDEMRVRGFGEGVDEVRKGLGWGGCQPWLGPGHEVGEIDISCDILKAAVFEDGGPKDALVKEVGSQ
jgi:hypothetical protein